MLLSASQFVLFFLKRLETFVLRSDAALPVAYAAGLLASRWIGEGAAGHPLLWLSAPAVIGLLIRFCRDLTPADVLSLSAVHVTAAAAMGDAPLDALIGLGANLIAIACGAAAFFRLRAFGFITSQVRVAFAVLASAGSVALAAMTVAALADPVATWATFAVSSAAAFVGAVLTLMVTLTLDREDTHIVADDPDLDGRRPSLWEHLAAGSLVAALALASLGTGGQEAALAASVALLWFALRLGLFATAVAAFAFAIALLGLAGAGRLPALMAGADPVNAELLRYVALALLSIPSILVASAVHDQKRQSRVFAYRAMHDGLTRLVNRTRFLEVLDRATDAATGRGTRFALLLIDLDHFKTVNDSFGHARGDALLVEVSNRLRQTVRASDVVARIGGDEFAVVAPVRTVEDAMALSRRLVETINMPWDLGGVDYAPSITLGGVLSPDSTGDARQLMLLADEALYMAKAAGRNCWRFSASLGDGPSLVSVWNADGERAKEVVYID